MHDNNFSLGYFLQVVSVGHQFLKMSRNKRPNYENGHQGKNSYVQNAWEFPDGINNVVSVSYTHLDVYKRQPLLLNLLLYYLLNWLQN